MPLERTRRGRSDCVESVDRPNHGYNLNWLVGEQYSCPLAVFKFIFYEHRNILILQIVPIADLKAPEHNDNNGCCSINSQHLDDERAPLSPELQFHMHVRTSRMNSSAAIQDLISGLFCLRRSWLLPPNCNDAADSSIASRRTTKFQRNKTYLNSQLATSSR